MEIFKNNLKRLFKNKLNIIFMIVVPVVLNLIFVVNNNTNQKIDVGVIDNDKSELTKTFKQSLENEATIVDVPKNEVKNYILDSKVDAVVVIPKGYAKDTINGMHPEVEFYSMKETNASVPIKMFVTGFFDTSEIVASSANQNEKLFYQILDDYTESKVVSKTSTIDALTKEKDQALQSTGLLALGIMFLLTLSTTLIIKDRQINMYDKLMVSPLKKSQYYLQSILSFTIISFIQLVLLFTILQNVLGIDYGENIIGIFLCSLLFSVFCISLGVMISRYSKNVKQANTIITLLNLPLLMIGGCFWDKEMMPTALQNVSRALPTNWFISANEQMINGSSILDVSPYFLMLTVLTIVLYILSFRGKEVR